MLGLSPKPPKKHPFRLTLRTLAVLILGVAIGLTVWNQLILRPSARERISVEHALKLGAKISTADNRPPWVKDLLKGIPITKVTAVNLEGAQVADADLVFLKDFPKLGGLILKKTSISNDGMPNILRLTKLVQLNLAHTKATDMRLDALTELEDLDLSENQITHLSLGKMAKLQTLNLRSTNLNQSNLTALKELSGLETLDLRGTKITDDDLKHLQSLANLKTLYLYDTPVTDRGVESLRQILPRLNVMR